LFINLLDSGLSRLLRQAALLLCRRVFSQSLSLLAVVAVPVVALYQAT